MLQVRHFSDFSIIQNLHASRGRLSVPSVFNTGETELQPVSRRVGKLDARGHLIGVF